MGREEEEEEKEERKGEKKGGEDETGGQRPTRKEFEKLTFRLRAETEKPGARIYGSTRVRMNLSSEHQRGGGESSPRENWMEMDLT